MPLSCFVVIQSAGLRSLPSAHQRIRYRGLRIQAPKRFTPPVGGRFLVAADRHAESGPCCRKIPLGPVTESHDPEPPPTISPAKFSFNTGRARTNPAAPATVAPRKNINTLSRMDVLLPTVRAGIRNRPAANAQEKRRQHRRWTDDRESQWRPRALLQCSHDRAQVGYPR